MANITRASVALGVPRQTVRGQKALPASRVTGSEPIRFFIDQPSADLLPRVHELAEQEHPALIVVDMLAGILPVKPDKS
jgi:hypothetical protein